MANSSNNDKFSEQIVSMILTHLKETISDNTKTTEQLVKQLTEILVIINSLADKEDIREIIKTEIREELIELTNKISSLKDSVISLKEYISRLEGRINQFLWACGFIFGLLSILFGVLKLIEILKNT